MLHGLFLWENGRQLMRRNIALKFSSRLQNVWMHNAARSEESIYALNAAVCLTVTIMHALNVFFAFMHAENMHFGTNKFAQK